MVQLIIDLIDRGMDYPRKGWPAWHDIVSGTVTAFVVSPSNAILDRSVI
jgi:hypothetical protein